MLPTAASTVWSGAVLILAGLAVGVLIAAPVGPVNILCIQRTLERGFWGGLAAGIGAVLGDGLLAAAAVFGIGAVSGLMTEHERAIKLVGALVLIAFGVKLFLAKPKMPVARARSWAQLRRVIDWTPAALRPALRLPIWRVVPHAAIIPQTFFLTITNPGAILGMFAILGGLTSAIGGIEGRAESLTLVTSAMGGSLLWWMGLSHLISRVRHRVTTTRLRQINQAAAVVLFLFGGVLLAQLASQHFGGGGAVAGRLERVAATVRALVR